MAPSRPGCVLALDIGEKRIGIAASDDCQKVAFPVAVLPAQEVVGVAASFRRILEDYCPVLLVCGLPMSLSGEEGPQAAGIRKVAEGISSATGIEACFSDERLSSAQAKRILRENGVDERKARGSLDKIAAALFLQSWLDSQQVENGAGEPDSSAYSAGGGR